MIQVSVPASVPVRDFAYNAEVKLVNPMFGACLLYTSRCV